MALKSYHYTSCLVILVLFKFSAENKDYCSVECKEGHHTMCEKYFKPGGNDCNEYTVFLFDHERTFILDAINTWRQDVANGMMTNLPEASDMVMLRWDAEACNISTRWTEQCDQMTTDRCRRQLMTSRDDGGQCMSEWSRKGAVKRPGHLLSLRKEVMKEVIDSWFSLGKDLNEDSIDMYKTSSESVKYFTQAVWARTDRVGCGFSSNGTLRDAEFRMVCNFYAAGNIENSPVYLRGAPCSACPSHYPHCSDKYPGLCTAKPPKSSATLVVYSSSILIIFTGHLIALYTYM